MALRLVPIDAPSAVGGADPAVVGTADGSAPADAGRPQAAQDGIELGFAHPEAEVLDGEVLVGLGELQREPGVDIYRRKDAQRRFFPGHAEQAGQQARRRDPVAGGDDKVVEFDHGGLPVSDGLGDTGRAAALVPTLLGARARVLGQAVGRAHPGEPLLDKGMVLRRHAVRIVEAGAGDVELVGRAVVLVGQGGAAGRAKAAQHVRARVVGGRVAMGKTQPAHAHAEPGHGRRTGHAPAIAAVTEGAMENLAIDGIAHRAAKTSALQRHDRPRILKFTAPSLA